MLRCNGRQRVTIGHTVTQRDLVHPVVVIPEIKPAIGARNTEHPSSCGAPCPGTEVRFVVHRVEQRGFELFKPQLGSPVTDSQESLGVLWVTSHGVSGAKMGSIPTFARLAEPGPDLDILLGLLIQKQNRPLLSPHQELRGTSLLHPLQSNATQSPWLFFRAIGQFTFIQRLLQLAHIPEDASCISGYGYTLRLRLALQPRQFVDRIPMRHLHGRGRLGSLTFSEVVEIYSPIVTPTGNKIRVTQLVVCAYQG
mmetsp:Transcript_45644/g.120727  ORF Transcript_45644/g.120727 Transcript_45644/m.120727 type:complete len:253 (-) Transcript_45644:713-1471(-)